MYAKKALTAFVVSLSIGALAGMVYQTVELYNSMTAAGQEIHDCQENLRILRSLLSRLQILNKQIQRGDYYPQDEDPIFLG